MKKCFKILMLFIFATVVMAVPANAKPESQKHFESATKMFLKGDLVNWVKELDSSLDVKQDKEEIEMLKLFEPLVIKYSNKITYTITDVKEKGNKSNIKLRIKAPSLSGAFVEVMNHVLENPNVIESEEEMFKEMLKSYGKIIDKNNFPYIEKNLSLNLTKKGDKWDLDNDENTGEYMKILFAGIMDM